MRNWLLILEFKWYGKMLYRMHENRNSFSLDTGIVSIIIFIQIKNW